MTNRFQHRIRDNLTSLLVEVERPSPPPMRSSQRELIRGGHAAFAVAVLIRRQAVRLLLHRTAILQRNDGKTAVRVAIRCRWVTR